MKFYLLLAICSAISISITSAESRTWTSSDGREITAEFIESDGTIVKIKLTSTGKTFELPLDRLSAADQAWVKEELKRIEPVPGPYGKLITGEWVQTTYEDLPYCIYGKDLDGRKKYPLVVYMHGKTKNNENGKQLSALTRALSGEELYQKHPSFVIAPLCYQPYGSGEQDHWIGKPGQEMIALIKDMINNCPSVDSNRIYLTGNSMGGNGVMMNLSENPKLFAAGLSLCQGTSPMRFADGIRKNMPIWMFHGDEDTTVKVEFSRRWVEPMKRNKNFTYTELKGMGHGIQKHISTLPEVYDWIFAQNLED